MPLTVLSKAQTCIPLQVPMLVLALAPYRRFLQTCIHVRVSSSPTRSSRHGARTLNRRKAPSARGYRFRQEERYLPNGLFTQGWKNLNALSHFPLQSQYRVPGNIRSHGYCEKTKHLDCIIKKDLLSHLFSYIFRFLVPISAFAVR